MELWTVNKASWWTDSNGIVAFNEPGLMGIEVYFHVASPVLEVPSPAISLMGSGSFPFAVPVV